jgi:hypothetical protein
VDVEGDVRAFAGQGGEGGYADGDVVAYATAVDDGLVGGFREEASAEMGDHVLVIVAGDSSQRVLKLPRSRLLVTYLCSMSALAI